jgi:MFS family permease
MTTGNARIAGLEEDLKLEGYDYNILLSAFYVSYIVFEMPATLCCKLIGMRDAGRLPYDSDMTAGPGWFLPLTSLGFGAMSLATAFVQNRAQACAVRFLLGVFETGVMPGSVYYLSRWYKRSELTFRLGLWITMAPFAGAFGGLIASGILNLSSVGSLRGWQM